MICLNELETDRLVAVLRKNRLADVPVLPLSGPIEVQGLLGHERPESYFSVQRSRAAPFPWTENIRMSKLLGVPGRIAYSISFFAASTALSLSSVVSSCRFVFVRSVFNCS